MRLDKLVKSFKKNKNSKKKPWVDRELSGLTKTVIKLGSALKKQPLVQLKNNFLKYSKECKKVIKRKRNQHRKELFDKLMNLRETDPKVNSTGNLKNFKI
jgi:ubiquinone biosynthesis protein Coq4